MVDIATIALRADTTDLRDGEVALERLATAGMQAERSTGRVAAQSTRANQALRPMGGNLRMVSMQLSQVASQGAATGNYLQALAIQAPDLALGFGAVGIAAGALVPIVYSLAQNFLSTRDNAQTLEEGLEALADIADKYSDAVDNAVASNEDLTEDFGAQAEAARELFQQRAALLRLDAEQQVRAGRASVLGEFERGGLTSADMLERARQVAEAQRGGPGGAQQQIDELNELSENLGISTEKALEFNRALEDLEQAQGPVETAEAMSRLTEIVEESGRGFEGLSETARATFIDINEAALTVLEIEADTRRLGENAAGGFSEGMASRTAAVANAAKSLAEAANNAFRETLEIQSPSRVFYRHGLDIARGLEEGLGDGSGSVRGTMQEMGNSLADDLGNAIANANSFAEAMDNVGDAIANMMRRSAAEAISTGFNTIFDSILGGLFGGGSGPGFVTSWIAGKRATGGPVQAGKGYLVGERGPEMFFPGASGNISPNGQFGGGAVEIFVRSEPGVIVETVRNEAGAMINQNNRAQAKAMPGVINEQMRDRRKAYL